MPESAEIGQLGSVLGGQRMGVMERGLGSWIVLSNPFSWCLR